MKITALNNRKKKRAFSNGIWYKKGIMFPSKEQKFLQLGLFGLIIMIQWGTMYI